MYKKQKLTLILLYTILVTSLIVYINHIPERKLSTTEKKIYNLYKSEDTKTINIKENLKDVPSISIMSYNIHDGKDKNGKYTIEEIKKFLQESNVDIICLQEVRYSQDILLRDDNEYKSQYVSNVNTEITPTGLSTYSKYPLIESNHILLPSKGEQRGALHTVYNVKGEKLNVINVHLGLNRKERVEQVREIVRYIETLSGDVIIAGDFNQAPLAINRLIDVGKYHGYEYNTTFMPVDVRIDYIFITTDNIYSTTYERIDIDLSDHYPIVAKIKYKPKEIKKRKDDKEWEMDNIHRRGSH